VLQPLTTKRLFIVLVVLLLAGFSYFFILHKNTHDKNQAVFYLSQKNMGALSVLIHPVKGVRFSPYVYVETETDRVLTPHQLKDFFKESAQYVWGRYDGSGEPIKLPNQEYFEHFVYDHDYLHAEKISYNETKGKGNTINNIQEVYGKDISFIEYYFSGFEAQFEGLDWAALILIFEKHQGKDYLIGIIHNNWTI